MGNNGKISVSAYWKAVAIQAAREARKILNVGSTVWLVIGIATSVAVIAVLLLLGSEDASVDEIIVRLTLAALVALAFPFVFGWRLIHIPAEESANKDRNIAALASEVSKRTIRQNHVLGLSLLREKGQLLASMRIKPEEYETWLIAVVKWQHVVIVWLATYFTHQDATSFNTVRYMKIEQYGHKINDAHNDKILGINTRLDKLDSIMKRYVDEWSPITKEERALINTQLAAVEMEVIAPNGNETLNEEGG